EPLIRQIRNGMQNVGIPVESSKGEAWPGQQEINFRYADALTMADRHTIYKNGAKEIAHLNDCSITFMAKPDHTWIGNSCHIHASLWRDGSNAFAGESEAFRQFLAGWIACARELAIFLAPTINSYKRYAAGSWAPTSLAWGHDNRTCGFRIVGHGRSQRVETRIPGGDVNPYLAFAALIAAGLHGIDQGLELPPALEGNAYESDAERFPSTLREAIAALESGTMARAALGDEVVDHYLNYARTEQRLFDEVVTCWERERLFERGWVAAHGARPGDGAADRRAAPGRRRGDRRGGRAREGGVPRVAGRDPARPRTAPAPARDARRGARRGAGPDRVAQRRQADLR